MSVPYFYIYIDADEQWRWRYTASNSKIIAVSSESYHNLGDCEHAIDLIKQDGAGALILGDVMYKKNRP
jgi:uncharacterized protein YegP (UPF0339 family)